MRQDDQQLEIGVFLVRGQPLPLAQVLDHLLLRRVLIRAIEHGEVVVLEHIVPVVRGLPAGDVHDEEIGLDFVGVAALVEELGHEVLSAVRATPRSP